MREKTEPASDGLASLRNLADLRTLRRVETRSFFFFFPSAAEIQGIKTCLTVTKYILINLPLTGPQNMISSDSRASRYSFLRFSSDIFSNSRSRFSSLKITKLLIFLYFKRYYILTYLKTPTINQVMELNNRVKFYRSNDSFKASTNR